MDGLFARNCRSSKSYREEESNLWDNLGVHEAVSYETKIKTDAQAFDDEGDLVFIKSAPLNFKQRFRLLIKGGEVPFEITTAHTVLKTEEEMLPVDEKARKATRQWVLESAGAYPNKKANQPDPKEQSAKAQQLVVGFERQHNPDLVEAVKRLPKASEILLKAPRELTPEEKRKLNRVFKAIVTGKPVSGLKVTL